MTPATIGTFRIGEDVVIALDIVEGDAAAIGTITAGMRRMVAVNSAGQFQPDQNQTPIAVIVSPRAASGTIEAGWNLTVPANVTAALAPGLYGIDAKMTATTGSIDITDSTAVISLTRAAV